VPAATRPPAWLLACAAAFGLGLILLLASSLFRPTPPSFPVRPLAPSEVGDSLVIRTVTLDARDASRWIGFDFSRGAVVGLEDRTRWDLAVRRYRMIVNGGPGFSGNGGVLEVSQRAYDTVDTAPASGYRLTTLSAGGDSSSTVLDGWYRYHFLSHLLLPRPATYVLRTANAAYAKLRILSYYCPGAEPGCLTFEYTYQGDGSRSLTGVAAALPRGRAPGE